MTRVYALTHEFVEYIPDQLAEGKMYVSIPYATAVHNCFCGCGSEVVTPISPTDWRLTFNGDSISLEPSIGNWNFQCRSHYWIVNNRVKWADSWSRARIEAARDRDRQVKASYFDGAPVRTSAGAAPAKPKQGIWRRRLLRWIRSWRRLLRHVT